jgi:hypothetical protein
MILGIVPELVKQRRSDRDLLAPPFSLREATSGRSDAPYMRTVMCGTCVGAPFGGDGIEAR